MDIFLHEGFSMGLEHRLVMLDYAADIARFSFVVQNSLSPLDLAQLEDSNSVYHDLFEFSDSSVLDSTIQYPRYLINTEEKCRKILSTTRDFLYRLHLDLPNKREGSLKDGPEPEDMLLDSCRRHIGKITVDPDFHFSVLSHLVKEAVNRSGNKIKMIKWLLMFDTATENILLNNQDMNYFVNCIYSEVTEPAFVKAFLKKFDLSIWMAGNERPEFLEFFLPHLCQNERTLNDNKASYYDLIDMCIRSLCFLNIGPILKYQYGPRVPERNNLWVIYILPFKREWAGLDALSEAENWMSPRRFYLLVQFLFIYYSRDLTSSATECLRLLWYSVPDAFFSSEEIKMVLQAGLSSETIQDMYNFYSGAVRAFHARTDPRSLKHLCRPAVRRMLSESGFWIPDGIKLIDVPRGLESFLNLED